MNRKLMENLFFKLVEKKIGLNDRILIHKYFIYETVDALTWKTLAKADMREYLLDKRIVIEMIDLFEHFEAISVKMDSYEYSMFFFVLAQILRMKFDCPKYADDNRENFEKEFELFKQKHKLK